MKPGIIRTLINLMGGLLLGTVMAEVADYGVQMLFSRLFPDHWIGYGGLLFGFALPRVALLCIVIYGVAIWGVRKVLTRKDIRSAPLHSVF